MNRTPYQPEDRVLIEPYRGTLSAPLSTPPSALTQPLEQGRGSQAEAQRITPELDVLAILGMVGSIIAFGGLFLPIMYISFQHLGDGQVIGYFGFDSTALWFSPLTFAFIAFASFSLDTLALFRYRFARCPDRTHRCGQVGLLLSILAIAAAIVGYQKSNQMDPHIDILTNAGILLAGFAIVVLGVSAKDMFRYRTSANPGETLDNARLGLIVSGLCAILFIIGFGFGFW